MSKFKIINLIDKLFISVSIYLIIYAWINFFIRNLWITFILSLIFSFACTYIIFYIFNKKSSKKTNKKTYLDDVENTFLAFRLLSETDKLKTLFSIISKDSNCEILNESIIVKNNERVEQIFIKTDEENLTQYSLISTLAKREKNATLVKVIVNNYSPNINTKILKNLQIELITKFTLYDNFFKANLNVINTSQLNSQNNKIEWKILMKNFFLPNKSKSYFLCGLILIFSSIILPFKTYYLIFGSALLICSIICKILPIIKH